MIIIIAGVVITLVSTLIMVGIVITMIAKGNKAVGLIENVFEAENARTFLQRGVQWRMVYERIGLGKHARSIPVIVIDINSSARSDSAAVGRGGVGEDSALLGSV
eukprot:TRINITY_DN780_c0_g1_i1.p3 TRINITY_DN780_c0_g1~~TRINITY_DN780_c0_g1_i1.p3  ORF type:complete len:105 (+),score=27.54 TRINITY_DN780_c0_g1_i1:682-996(+)